MGMSRICGFRDTTTGRPCTQVVEDFHDHCEAGHLCPIVPTEANARNRGLEVNADSFGVEELFTSTVVQNRDVIKRRFYRPRTTWREGYSRYQEVPRKKASLTGSLVEDGSHFPLLYLNCQARLIPSATEGHFNLYLDHPMSWKRYKRLMRSMVKAGLLDREFYRKARKHYQAFVETPSSYTPDSVGRPHYRTSSNGAESESSQDEKLLVGSRLISYDHLPVLDVDFPAILLEAGKKGHYSLYFDHTITWGAYRRVMKSMVGAGLIDRDFYRETLKNGQAFVPLPPEQEQTRLSAQPSTENKTEPPEAPEERVALCRGCGADTKLSYEGFCEACADKNVVCSLRAMLFGEEGISEAWSQRRMS